MQMFRNIINIIVYKYTVEKLIEDNIDIKRTYLKICRNRLPVDYLLVEYEYIKNILGRVQI